MPTHFYWLLHQHYVSNMLACTCTIRISNYKLRCWVRALPAYFITRECQQYWESAFPNGGRGGKNNTELCLEKTLLRVKSHRVSYKIIDGVSGGVSLFLACTVARCQAEASAVAVLTVGLNSAAGSETSSSYPHSDEIMRHDTRLCTPQLCQGWPQGHRCQLGY